MKTRNTTILISAFFSLVMAVQAAQASWLIDPKKFHISAHGRTGCVECHDNIGDQALHPNPANVNKKRADFFSPEKCTACHDGVMDDLDKGMHGAKRVGDRDKYAYCMRCHKPHTQQRLGDEGKGTFIPGKPRHEQCGACHEEEVSALPELSAEDRACMACHAWVDPDDPAIAEKIRQLCFHCHGRTGTKAQKMTGKMVSLINKEAYRSTPHTEVACTVCHPASAQYGHAKQRPGDCSQCHLPHDEKTARDAHMGVACESCHLDGVKPVKDAESKRVIWARERKAAETSTIHHMIRTDDEASCRTCHFKGNQVGAVSMLLPAKSILCMPCHSATFSVGDTTTVMALIVFLAGMLMLFSYWLTGSVPGAGDKGPFGKLLRLLWSVIKSLFTVKLFFIIKAMIVDVLLQRRLFRRSRARWLIHGLIFFPFVFRFSWGLLALLGSLFKPESHWIWALVDKNNPVTALLFDISGVMLLLGVTLAFVRGAMRQLDQPPGLPAQDRPALALMAGIALVGFVLEGMRIAMTGWPEGAGFAVAGFVLSVFFRDPFPASELYGYVWYVHAILTGVFIAYLPFSRLLHIIMSPVVLAMNAVSEKE
ncbi:MAG: hypothetical protein GY849_00265 [Deltaproteobacteria bacterium]|nr:hypothetical protein [Deltaproteobacteria bacterium]